MKSLSAAIIGLLLLFFFEGKAQRLIKAEYFIDTDPGAGKGTSITFSKADSVNIQNISVPTSGLAQGFHILGLRVRDSLDFWSATVFSPFTISNQANSLTAFNTTKLVRAEYFIDSDPGSGLGTAITFATADSVNITNVNINTGTLSQGAHIIGIRVRDSADSWSAAAISPFTISTQANSLTAFNTTKLVRAEYFIDSDPGAGLGTPITFATADSVNLTNININTNTLGQGAHLLGLRVRDSADFWSATYLSPFTISSQANTLTTFNQTRLVEAEYFIDSDPGAGLGTPITFATADSINLTNVNINTVSIGSGAHILGLRVRDSADFWSATVISPFTVTPQANSLTTFNTSRLVKAEYFIDSDPGAGLGIPISFATADSINLKNINIKTDTLGLGVHLIGLRVRDSSGLWSATYISPFTITNAIASTDSIPKQVFIAAEYFLGTTDPGVGNGTPISTLPFNTDSLNIPLLQIPIPLTASLGPNYVTFRLKQTDGYWSANQTIVFDICVVVPPQPTVTSATICGGTGTAKLVASGASTEEYYWYTSSYGGTPVYTSYYAGDSTYTTPTLTADQTYWVAQKTTGCNSSRSPSNVVVVLALNTPSSSNTIRCGKGTVTLQATGAPLGGTFHWYDSVSSKTWIGTGPTYTTDTLYASRKYFISTVSNGGLCESPGRDSLAVIINVCTPQTITFPAINNVIYGFNQFVVPQATASSGLPVSYQIVSGNAKISNDTIYPLGIGTITLLASQPGDGSTISAAPPVKQTFEVLANGTTLVADYIRPVCTGSQLTLIATSIINGKYFWTGPNGFKSSLQSPSIYNVNISDTGNYYLTVQSPSDTLSAIVHVAIFQSPLKISLYSIQQQECVKNYILFTQGDSLSGYQWYFNAKKLVGFTDSTLVPVATGVYSVTGFNTQNCSISSSPLYVDVTPDSLPYIQRFYNPSRLQATPGVSYEWFVNNYIIVNSNVQSIPLVFSGTYIVKVTDTKGCVRFSPPIVFSDSGLIELRQENISANGEVDLDSYDTQKIFVAPVPSKDLTNISWVSPVRGTVNLTIVNTLGVEIQKWSVNKSNEQLSQNLDVSSWSAGVYLVFLEYKGRNIIGKIVVSR